MKRILRKGWTALLAQAGRHYFAGDTIDDAVTLSQRLFGMGYSVTLGHLFDVDVCPQMAFEEYNTALSRDGWSEHDSYLSLKAKDIEFGDEYFARLLDKSTQRQVPLHLDSIGPEHADETYALLEAASHRADVPQLGVTIPGRWQRSVADARRAVELGVIPRICKGQWVDPAAPSLDPTAGFLDVVRELAGRAELVRIATHDQQLLAEAATILATAGTAFEIELLYGLPMTGALEVATAAAARVRIYVPYGKAWLPYGVNRLRRSPRYALAVLRDVMRGPYDQRFPAYDVPTTSRPTVETVS